MGLAETLAGIFLYFKSTPRRTFILYPALSLLGETIRRGRPPRVDLRCLPLLVWGYSQYRLAGRYLSHHGLGGPKPDSPPTKLVTSGPYAFTRNPMYLGHLIFMLGLTLALRSPIALALGIVHATWFHTSRVPLDERLLAERYGQAYQEYCSRVRRWLPGLF